MVVGTQDSVMCLAWVLNNHSCASKMVCLQLRACQALMGGAPNYRTMPGPASSSARVARPSRDLAGVYQRALLARLSMPVLSQ